MHEAPSAALLAGLKARQCSLQAAVSVAMLLSLLRVEAKHQTDRQLPLSGVSLLAVQMRQLCAFDPAIDAEDMIVGGAPVWVETALEGDARVWDLVGDATVRIRRRLEENPALGLLRLLETPGAWPEATVFTSNVGASGCRREYGEGVRVGEMLLMGGVNGFAAPKGGISVHLTSFDGGVQGALSYIHPAVSHQQAEMLADAFVEMLHQMASDHPDLSMPLSGVM